MSTTGTFLIDTDDLGEAEAELCVNYGRINIGAPHDTPLTRTRIWRNEIGGLTLDDVEYTYPMTFAMEPLEMILLCRFRSGGLEERLPDGGTVTFGPGDVAAFGAVEGRPFTGVVHSATYDAFCIDRRWFNDIAGNADTAVRLRSSQPLSTSANRFLSEAFDHARRGLLVNADADNAPLVASTLTNYLAAAVVSAFPSDAPDMQTLARVPQASAVLVRRAVAFIDEHAHTDISPAEIAAAANLAPQVLQMMFARHYGCTPMQYVRRVRLDHAHRELVAADPDTTSVIDVAKRWGFTSVSRFAVSYRLAYGRSPAATLRASSFRAPH